ncbi:MAG TPA: efflux RND transporter periplasmic adaptor subunit, partial [Sphingobium sp.]
MPVAQVIVRELAPSSEFNGSLTAPKSVELRPRVSGQIIGVDVPEGGMVRQGQTLFRIDPRPFQVAVDQAAGNLAQAEAQAAQAQADFARAERLIATGAISRKEYDAAVAQRRAGLASTQAARAAVAAARLDLSFTRVTAPI